MLTALFCLALWIACCGVGLLTIWIAAIIENKEREVKEIPYIAIGNEELDEALAVNEGDIVSIVVDGTRHKERSSSATV